MLDRLLTVSEASKLAGFSRSKMYTLARSGRLPFKQFGATYHISVSELSAALGLSIKELGSEVNEEQS